MEDNSTPEQTARFLMQKAKQAERGELSENEFKSAQLAGLAWLAIQHKGHTSQWPEKPTIKVL